MAGLGEEEVDDRRIPRISAKRIGLTTTWAGRTVGRDNFRCAQAEGDRAVAPGVATTLGGVRAAAATLGVPAAGDAAPRPAPPAPTPAPAAPRRRCRRGLLAWLRPHGRGKKPSEGCYADQLRSSTNRCCRRAHTHAMGVHGARKIACTSSKLEPKWLRIIRTGMI